MKVCEQAFYMVLYVAMLLYSTLFAENHMKICPYVMQICNILRKRCTIWTPLFYVYSFAKGQALAFLNNAKC